jgi:putative transposase
LLVNRVEKHCIKRSDPMWVVIDQKCWEAKSLYNCANYIITTKFKENGKWIRYGKLDNLMHDTLQYKRLGSQAAQNTLTLLDRNWKSFFNGIKDWSKKDGEGYFGMPELPRFKKKNGRSILMVKNIQCRIKERKLIFSWKPLKPFSGIPTHVTGKLQQVRFVPKGGCYYMEIVYQKNIQEPKPFNNRIAGIDLGVNNFVTMGNNIGIKPIIVKGGTIKSMNQWYNKEISRISNETKMIWNNRMRRVTDKHLKKLDTYTHLVSKRIVEYCKDNDINTLVVGLSKEWKNGVNLGHVNNQNFVYIPFEKFIGQLVYKCQNVGITCVVNEEKFTSGTSFLDNELPVEENYNIKRRIKRGLFKSNNGTLINADLNAAYQIIKKVYPSAFEVTAKPIQNGGSRGCDLHPVELCLN